MTWGFAFSSPAHTLASFFGSGVLRPAPGTWGTLAGWIFYALFLEGLPLMAQGAATLALLTAGAWASGVTGRDLGVHDHGSVVVDEVFAVWAVLMTVPASLPWQAAAFGAFRFFDIVKIPPADFFDEKCRNGWGVMLDDAVAAGYAAAALYAVRLAAEGL